VASCSLPGTEVAYPGFDMKPWFVLFVLWALSGIVTLRHAYGDDGASPRERESIAQADEPRYAF
jgi:hypothetical protein